MEWFRAHRRQRAAWLAGLILLVQVMTAAYACVAVGDDLGVPEPAVLVDCADHGPGSPDADQPLLCKAHCEQGQQLAQSTAGLDLQQALAALPVLLWVLPSAATAHDAALALPLSAQGPAAAGTLPLYLTLLVLRN
jgi:hypothetical protein